MEVATTGADPAPKQGDKAVGKTEGMVPARPLERQVELMIDVAALQESTRRRLQKLGRKMKAPGFRPGKVPFNIVQQQYGLDAHNEALGELLDQAWQQAVDEKSLRIAGRPRVEAKQDDGGAKLTTAAETPTQLPFIATFEIFPDIELAELGKLSIERPVLEVGEEEIKRTLEILRKQQASYEEVSRPAEDSDRVTIDFCGTIDGKEFANNSDEDYEFLLGGKKMLPDFEAAILGLTAGEEKKFEMKFPDDYGSEDIAGKTVQFEVKVKIVKQRILPEVNADFARNYGVSDGDIDKMREEIADNLSREVKHRIDARVKEQVMNALLTANPIDVPQSVLDMEVARLMESAREDMRARGLGSEDDLQPEWFAEQARRRVSLGLIIAELVEKKKLHASPEQIRAQVEDLAATFQDPQRVIDWHYSNRESLERMESLAVEDNVVAWVLASSKVKDKQISFDELMG